MLNKTNTAFDQKNNEFYSTQSVISKAYRLTHNQKMVYETLLKLERSAGAYELLEHLKKKGVNAAATVYRALNELKVKGLVQRIVSTRTFIALQKPKTEKDDSVLLICEHCGEVSSISDNKIGEVFEKSIEQTGYQVSTYHLELIVSCSSCRSKENKSKAFGIE
ncbi:MAG: transcriptional repressor [Kordiimonadaceae bacterium]|nr:transcriptional repressor [Kordiimonadaceae bacterium]